MQNKCCKSTRFSIRIYGVEHKIFFFPIFTRFIQAGGCGKKSFFHRNIYLKKPHDVTFCSGNIIHWNDLTACCSLILLQDCPSSPLLPLPPVPWQSVLRLLRVRWTIPNPSFCFPHNPHPNPSVFFPCWNVPHSLAESCAAPRCERKAQGKEEEEQGRNSWLLQPMKLTLAQLWFTVHSGAWVLFCWYAAASFTVGRAFGTFCDSANVGFSTHPNGCVACESHISCCCCFITSRISETFKRRLFPLLTDDRTNKNKLLAAH